MRVKKQDRDEAVEHLRRLVKPGDTVLCVLRHVSRSGMSRRIDFYTQGIEHERDCAGTGFPCTCCDPKPALYFLSGYISTVLGMTRHKDGGLVVGGCGMDMGFHVVNSLSYAIWGKYQCLGKEGRCPSNYHSNHRDTIQCGGEGTGDARKACWAPYDGTRDGARYRVSLLDHDFAVPLNPGLDKCANRGVLGVMCAQPKSAHERTCTTCKGKGRVPNPEGPERWDLEHGDGYALKSDWI